MTEELPMGLAWEILKRLSDAQARGEGKTLAEVVEEVVGERRNASGGPLPSAAGLEKRIRDNGLVGIDPEGHRDQITEKGKEILSFFDRCDEEESV